MLKFISDLPMFSGLQDAMAIVRYGRHPDLFITMTCNPEWKELKQLFFEEQNATMQADLVAHVFKLQQLLTDLQSGIIFGDVVAKVHVIEFQKHNLPHAHILLSFAAEDKLRGPADFDSIVSAQLPDKDTHPELYKLVCKHMMHGECGKDHPDDPCMREAGVGLTS